MNELELFAGAGGGILGGQLLGHRTVCAVEFDAYARSVLLARQNDGTFPPFPVWDDVRTFDGKPWSGIVDVVSGGFPCQDISVAGRGDGLDGERSGLWGEMARIISEVRPRFAFIENSPALVSRGLDRVLSDLAALGFDARWTVLGAADVGAHHQRDRIWILAHSRFNRCGIRKNEHINEPRCEAKADSGIDGEEVAMAYATISGFPQRGCSRKSESSTQGRARLEHESERCGKDVADTDTDSAQRQRDKCAFGGPTQYSNTYGPSWWASEPAVGRVVNGMAHRAHRLKAIGNGQVPQCRAAAWKLLGGP
jgi:DNA (cytosine-5)-methyltransferase 1